MSPARRWETEQNIGYLLCDVGRCVEARPFAARVLLETQAGDPTHHYADGLLARGDLAEGAAASAIQRARRVMRESATWIPDDLGQQAELHMTLALALEAVGAPRSEVLRAARTARARFVGAGDGARSIARLDRMLMPR